MCTHQPDHDCLKRRWNLADCGIKCNYESPQKDINSRSSEKQRAAQLSLAWQKIISPTNQVIPKRFPFESVMYFLCFVLRVKFSEKLLHKLWNLTVGNCNHILEEEWVFSRCLLLKWQLWTDKAWRSQRNITQESIIFSGYFKQRKTFHPQNFVHQSTPTAFCSLTLFARNLF